MIATAQGRRLPCDYTGCLEPGTVEVDAWVYCADHGGNTPPTPAARPRPDVDLNRVTPDESKHGIRLPEPGPIGLLLEQASGHSVPKVRRLADKIEAQLDDLRALIKQHAAEEARRQAEATAKAKAKAEVERLEKQLAAAKAALRGKPAPSTSSTSRPTDGRTAPLECRKGCGTVSRGGQGRAAHERTCNAGAA